MEVWPLIMHKISIVNLRPYLFPVFVAAFLMKVYLISGKGVIQSRTRGDAESFTCCCLEILRIPCYVNEESVAAALICITITFLSHMDCNKSPLSTEYSNFYSLFFPTYGYESKPLQQFLQIQLINHLQRNLIAFEKNV
ncbi:uncharacterized protein LOC119657556 [Hermetia illucens]|uniref:uncharacterized protein LOC119657556 n=1 Tax=Hermetia illucens TaxID=343691 RepID=UPI0018CC1CDB|nr:uncharacterized protein LOC119657556 [Hermetia illucens]